VLIEKHLHGIDVKGIVEKSRIGQEYNQYKNLANKVDVITDNSEYTMHNKVFIIDNKTVVTGSFNPTESADTRNDENMLIIHDTEIAAKFIEEFNALFNQ
ncbi:phospholipase, partial [Candidatus Woesearchaeota archaeon]|nr:phospholipase [Candidatus Woesearchaeota archaeon]